MNLAANGRVRSANVNTLALRILGRRQEWLGESECVATVGSMDLRRLKLRTKRTIEGGREVGSNGLLQF